MHSEPYNRNLKENAHSIHAHLNARDTRRKALSTQAFDVNVHWIRVGEQQGVFFGMKNERLIRKY